MASKFLLGVPSVRFSCDAIQKISQDFAEKGHEEFYSFSVRGIIKGREERFNRSKFPHNVYLLGIVWVVVELLFNSNGSFCRELITLIFHWLLFMQYQ